MKLVLAALLLVGACSKKDDAPTGQRPVPIPTAERQRGADACKVYIDRACACAKAHADRAEVAKRCELDAALPSAMELALGIDDEPNVAAEDVFRAQTEARKVISTCIEGANWLTTHGCP
ncbi:MAG TPA: hypothetical protein VL463_07750 [Kofleriaceae bacterium]|nr:hypothetical protein [Kofleriaceae bacterium]